MPFVRRKRGRLLLVHSRRQGGKVVQQELAGFGSAPELEEVLGAGAWEAWCRSLERAHPDLSWDWQAIHRDLAAGIPALSAAPSPSAAGDALAKLSAELVVALARLAPARAADRAILDPARPALTLLAHHLHRVLGPAGASNWSPPVAARSEAAEAAFDQAMEHWWRGDRKRAVQGYWQVLQADPSHADAHNHLGIAALDEGRLDQAEDHFRTAIDSGARHIEVQGGLLEWGYLENRPYLRAHGNLALVLRRRGRWAEAAAIHEQMLRWNPTDNQGVRYLLGEEYHRMGDRRRALAAYQRAEGDAGTDFGLGLLLLEADRVADAERALLRGMAENRYVAPMLLAERWSRLDGWHGSNLAEPEHAAWIARSLRDLWRARPEYLDQLAGLWKRASVVAWRRQLDDIMVALRDGRGSTEERRALLEVRDRLVEEEHLDRVRGGTSGRLASVPGLPAAEEVHVAAEAGTSITDMRSRVVPRGKSAHLPGDFRSTVAYEGRIVEAGSAWGRAEPLDTAIRCRRRPQRRPCTGHLRVRLSAGQIVWACTRCRDHGRIHHWEGLEWDFSKARAPRDAARVPVSWTDFAWLRQIGYLPMRIVLARAEWGEDGPTLVGSVAELREAATASAACGGDDAAAAILAGLGDGGPEA